MSTITPIAAYWHALNLMFEVNPYKLLPISMRIGGVEGFFKINENQLLTAGLDPSSTTRIISNRKTINPEGEWEKLQRLGIGAICFGQAGYPQKLSEIPSPPPIIYVRGNPEVLKLESMAVVGSRKLSSYGKQAILALVPPMVEHGLAITSGMAYGADAAALETCLENKGIPIAVLASSLANHEISPHGQAHLAFAIEKVGCLVSENPPGRIVQKLHFPLRNRIVSGLSSGVVVIEGATKSGSMITANLAVEQNREVFAVPGSIFSQNSAGTLDLIKRGAKCLTEFKDIATEFGWDIKAAKVLKIKRITNSLQKAICSLLAASPTSFDDIISKTQAPAGDILAALTELELSGVLKKSAGSIYAKIK